MLSDGAKVHAEHNSQLLPQLWLKDENDPGDGYNFILQVRS